MSLLAHPMATEVPPARAGLILDPDAELLCETVWRVATRPGAVVRLSEAGMSALARPVPEPARTGAEPVARTRAWGPRVAAPVARAAVVVHLAHLVRTGAPVRVEVVETALALLAAGVVPVMAAIPRATSGDIPPPSSLAAALDGTGEVIGPDGRPQPAAATLQAAGLRPITPDGAERDALADGVPVAVAGAALAVTRAQGLLATAAERLGGPAPVTDAGARHLDHARTMLEVPLNEPTAGWALHVGMAADAVNVTVTHLAVALCPVSGRNPWVTKMRRHCLAHAVGPDPLEGCGVAAVAAWEQVDRLAALLGTLHAG